MEAEQKETQTAEAPAAAKAAPATFRHILGEKLGMTQLFDSAGNLVPVTALRAGPCPVVAVRTAERDGYSAVQIGFGPMKESRLTKADLGRFKKAGVAPVRHVREFRSDAKGVEVGQQVGLERFAPGDYVDVRGTGRGKGMAGGMKRHGFAGLPTSHGASDKVRSPGSLASRRSLGRVMPGQRMAGHMGHHSVCVQKLEVVEVRPEENLLYVRGAVPGVPGGLLLVSETVKHEKKKVASTHVVKKSKDPLKAAKAAAASAKKKK